MGTWPVSNGDSEGGSGLQVKMETRGSVGFFVAMVARIGLVQETWKRQSSWRVVLPSLVYPAVDEGCKYIFQVAMILIALTLKRISIRVKVRIHEFAF